MDGRVFISALALALGLRIAIGFGLGFLLPWLAAGLLVLLVLFTAIATRQGLSATAMPDVITVAFDDPEVPEEVADEWCSLETELATEGLVRATARRSEPSPARPEEFTACWTAPCGTFFVASTVVYPPGRSVPQRSTTVATWTRDGVEVETTSRDDLPPLGRLDGVRVASYPGLGNKTLVALHRKRLARLRPSPRPEDVHLPGGDAVEFTREAHSRFCDLMCRAGYLRPGHQAGYRSTFWGWAVWTAAYLWPILRLRQCMARRRSHAILREFAPTAQPPVRSSHWLAAVAGVAGVTAAMSLPFGLGVTSWTFLGIAGASGIQTRRGRPLGLDGIVLGGAAGAVPVATLMGVPALLFLPAGVPASGLGTAALSWVLPAGLYTLGAAAFFWGWSGIPYLHASPSTAVVSE